MATTPPPYTLVSKNGNVVIDAQTINTANSSLALAGKNYSGWGAPYAQNFLSLVENFASNVAPANPRRGQLWYDVSGGLLKVYDSGNWNLSKSSGFATPVHITLAGDVTSTPVSFDGSSDITINAALPVKLAGGVGTKSNEPNTLYNTPAIVVDPQGRVVSVTNTGGDGAGPPVYVTTFNGRSLGVTLNSTDVITALGYTPTNGGITNFNGRGGPTITLSSPDVTNALGFSPLNKAGDAMFGLLNMQSNRIAGLGAPAVSGDAARVDDVNFVAATRTQRVFNGGGQTGYNVTVSPNSPSGGSNGDVWYRY